MSRGDKCKNVREQIINSEPKCLLYSFHQTFALYIVLYTCCLDYLVAVLLSRALCCRCNRKGKGMHSTAPTSDCLSESADKARDSKTEHCCGSVGKGLLNLFSVQTTYQ